jgi:predicted GH43/DUF377 family glycosyl hydrolase
MEKIEKRLVKKIKEAKVIKSPRKPKIDDIFERAGYLCPEDFETSNYRRKVGACFNPGAMLVDDRTVEIYPRFVFDYYKYVSSIGRFKVDMEDLLSGRVEKPISAEIVLFPDVDGKDGWDFGGDEDPRVVSHNKSVFVLFTGNIGDRHKDNKLSEKVNTVLALAEIQDGEIKRKDYFKIRGKTDKEPDFIPEGHKDAAFVRMNRSNEAGILTRLSVRGYEGNWFGQADLNDMVIPEDTLEIILPPMEGEIKMGWSTNTIDVGNDQYLIGWHSVLKSNLSYVNGLALVSGEGKLLAISDYLLAPKKATVVECYGDRPLVVFGGGLIKYKDKLVWIGGVSDWAIGVFTVDFDIAMSKLKWVK